MFASGDITLQLFLYELLLLLLLVIQTFLDPLRVPALAKLDLAVIVVAAVNAFLGIFATSFSQQAMVAGNSFKGTGQSSVTVTVMGLLVLIFNMAVAVAILYLIVKLYFTDDKLAQLKKFWCSCFKWACSKFCK